MSGPTLSPPRRSSRRCGVVGALAAVVLSTVVGLAYPAPAYASGGECLPYADSVGNEQPWPPGPDLPYGIAPDGRSFEVRVPSRSEVTVSAIYQDRRTGALRTRRCVATNLLDSAAFVVWRVRADQPDLVVRDVGPFAVREL